MDQYLCLCFDSYNDTALCASRKLKFHKEDKLLFEGPTTIFTFVCVRHNNLVACVSDLLKKMFCKNGLNRHMGTSYIYKL